MAETSGCGDITGNVIFRPALLELTFFSRRWLNRFGQLWTRLKATVCPNIKFKINMAATSGSGDITGNVIFKPAPLEPTFFSRRWLNRFVQLWTRLKAIVLPKIKFEINMAATSVTYMPTLPGEKKTWYRAYEVNEKRKALSHH